MRIAGVYRIKPEFLTEYKEKHDAIWPEMKAAIHDAGITNYSIFHYRDGVMFSYFETDLERVELEERMAFLEEKKIKQEWEKAMAKYFVAVDTETRGPEIEKLDEVFHLD